MEVQVKLIIQMWGPIQIVLLADVLQDLRGHLHGSRLSIPQVPKAE